MPKNVTDSSKNVLPPGTPRSSNTSMFLMAAFWFMFFLFLLVTFTSAAVLQKLSLRQSNADQDQSTTEDVDEDVVDEADDRVEEGQSALDRVLMQVVYNLDPVSVSFGFGGTYLSDLDNYFSAEAKKDCVTIDPAARNANDPYPVAFDINTLTVPERTALEEALQPFGDAETLIDTAQTSPHASETREFCFSSEHEFLLSGDLDTLFVSSLVGGTEPYFTDVSEIRIFDGVYEFFPEALKGLAMISTRYGDAGALFWQYDVVDIEGRTNVMIEHCTVEPSDRQIVLNDEYTRTCSRQYIP